MDRTEKLVVLHDEAVAYLKGMLPERLSWEEVEREYLEIDFSDYQTMRDVFDLMLSSAQNSQMMPNVIGYWESPRREEIQEPLFDLNAQEIVSEYANDEELYAACCEKFTINNAESPRNLWRRWSKSAIDMARFLSQFKSRDEFKEFVDLFDSESIPLPIRPYTRLALPLLIERKIRGMGFALACDFLKELGLSNYPKPDVHILGVLYQLGLCPWNQLSAFETIIEMADAVGETPYRVDKIIWLICSGKFYNHLDFMPIRRHKNDFIKHMEGVLSM